METTQLLQTPQPGSPHSAKNSPHMNLLLQLVPNFLHPFASPSVFTTTSELPKAAARSTPKTLLSPHWKTPLLQHLLMR